VLIVNPRVIFLGTTCRYKLIKEVGDGTFGSVWRAINKQSGEVVSALLLSIPANLLAGISIAPEKLRIFLM